MATQVQFRGGTTTEHSSFNGAAREVTVDTTKQTVVVQDGSTNGGFPLLGEKNADNVKVHFGGNGTTDAGDIQIYHDASHSFIDHNGEGNLYIRTLGADEDLTIQAEKDLYLKVAAGDVAVKAIDTGAVELYNDGSVKLATSSTGVSITGAVESSTLNSASGTDLTLNAGGANRDVFLKVNGTTVMTVQGSTGKLLIGADGTSIKSNQLKFSSAGAAYIDHSTIDQDVIFRVSNSTDGSLGKTALVLKPTGRCGMGTDNPSAPLHIVGSDNNTTLLVESTDSDANVGPIIELFRNSSTPADNDALGRIDFRGEDNAGNASTFARIAVTALDEANNSEDGRIDFTTAVADTFTPTMSIAGNEVGIGVTDPDSLLHLEGSGSTAKIKLQRTGTTIGGSINTRDESDDKGLTYIAKDGNSGVPNHVFLTDAGSGAVEKMRIKTGGQVCIGTTDGPGEVGLYLGDGTNPAGHIYANGTHHLYILANAYYAGGWKYQGAGEAGSLAIADGNLTFNTAAANTGSAGAAITWAQVFQAKNSNGDLSITNGNLVVANGKGIDFSAQTATSATGAAISTNGELLDHYEEGSFTPKIRGNTTAGTFTSDATTSYYTRIGNVVTLTIYINYQLTGAGGYWELYDLPFTATSGNYAAGSVFIQHMDINDNVKNNVLYIGSSGTFIALYGTPDDASWIRQSVDNTTAGTNQGIIGSITYRTA